MESFLGADPADLLDFAQAAQSSSEQIDYTATTLSATLAQARWKGPDAQLFTGRWNSQHLIHLKEASEGLQKVAKILRLNADEQEKASALEGGGSHRGHQGGGDGDKPDNPDSTDDLGDYHDLPDNIPLDDRALDPTNIAQGQVGDCWFLSAAAAVAADDPQWIRDHMWRNPDGTWTVKMYDDGKPVYIQVEPTVPENAATDAQGDDNWLSVYEKAAAEYFGGDYEDIDGGHSNEAFEAITGKDADSEGEMNFDDIQDRLSDGPVAVGTESDSEGFLWLGDKVDNKHIVPNHAYIVDTVEDHVNPDTGKTERMIHVLNPWGPNGGGLEGDDPDQRWGDLWLTEDEYKDNFDSVYSVDSTK